MTIEEFLSSHPESRRVYDALIEAVAAFGPVDAKVTKSQVAFRDDKEFAWVWAPDQYLGPGHAPLVLTLSFPDHLRSPRWKSVVQTGKHRFTHHLELHSPSDVDDEVRGLIQQARSAASLSETP
jgi:hypothetical protein